MNITMNITMAMTDDSLTDSTTISDSITDYSYSTQLFHSLQSSAPIPPSLTTDMTRWIPTDAYNDWYNTYWKTVVIGPMRVHNFLSNVSEPVQRKTAPWNGPIATQSFVSSLDQISCLFVYRLCIILKNNGRLDKPRRNRGNAGGIITANGQTLCRTSRPPPTNIPGACPEILSANRRPRKPLFCLTRLLRLTKPNHHSTAFIIVLLTLLALKIFCINTISNNFFFHFKLGFCWTISAKLTNSQTLIQTACLTCSCLLFNYHLTFNLIFLNTQLLSIHSLNSLNICYNIQIFYLIPYSNHLVVIPTSVVQLIISDSDPFHSSADNNLISDLNILTTKKSILFQFLFYKSN